MVFLNLRPHQIDFKTSILQRRPSNRPERLGKIKTDVFENFDRNFPGDRGEGPGA